MKTIFLQILALISISVLIGAVYNHSLPDDCKGSKKLAWIREEKPVIYADPSAIADLVASTPDTAAKAAPVPGPDTAALVKADTASKRIKPADTANSRKIAQEKPVEEKVEVHNINYEQARKLKENPNVLFIDARNAEDFAKGHIEGAKNIFTHEFEQHMPEIMPIPRDKPVVVYCGGGACELSHELAEQLKILGFKRLFVYVGGWTEWEKKVANQ